ncbi:MAG: 3-hydroxyacyl-CoA dehydrogenase family protein [Deltaproteobacteria bacterium]|jgi:3-hydroxybutyryl-CoA dehydrogenase|nr:3-hydroxyacyl-CoA dehydrogenase family protein [Deltaproteobacteria bacterium]
MIETITVLGAGTMGYGISLNFALAGYAVNLFDVRPEALNNALLNARKALSVMIEEGLHTKEEGEKALAGIRPFTDRPAACAQADLLMEAMPENLRLKQDTFVELDALCGPDCIFASNTSSLKLTDICAPLSQSRKSRALITHYFNPAHLIPLVELLPHPDTPPTVLEEIEAMYKRAGKVSIRVLKDINGMIGNRIQAAIGREAFWLIENGYCSGKDLGRALAFGPCFRYATTDYLEIVDLGGVDIWSVVHDLLYKDINSSTEVSGLLKNKAASGEHGWKTGKGFYSYEGQAKAEVMERFLRNLARQLKVSKNYMF